jgi:hypothetical protein
VLKPTKNVLVGQKSLKQEVWVLESKERMIYKRIKILISFEETESSICNSLDYMILINKVGEKDTLSSSNKETIDSFVSSKTDAIPG